MRCILVNISVFFCVGLAVSVFFSRSKLSMRLSDLKQLQLNSSVNSNEFFFVEHSRLKIYFFTIPITQTQRKIPGGGLWIIIKQENYLKLNNSSVREYMVPWNISITRCLTWPWVVLRRSEIAPQCAQSGNVVCHTEMDRCCQFQLSEHLPPVTPSSKPPNSAQRGFGSGVQKCLPGPLAAALAALTADRLKTQSAGHDC